MKVLCIFGRHAYGECTRGLSIEYTSFIPALEQLGHEVFHFESWDRSAYSTYADLNRRLLTAVEECAPDVVFTVQRDYELWLETLAEIRARWPAIATVTWTTDDSWKFREVSRFIAAAYDAVATTYSYRVPDYHGIGTYSVLATQWAANSQFLRPPRRVAECRFPVSFVGAAYGERAKIIDKLRRAGIPVECFGSGWPAGPLSASSFPEVINSSVISLNFSSASKSSSPAQLKARTFEVPGSGSVLFTQSAPDLENYYDDGKEIVTFTVDNVIERVRELLNNPDRRERIAWAGYKRTVKEHTYESRVRELLAFANSMASNRRAVRVHAVANQRAAEQAHRMTPLLTIARESMLFPARAVWGKQKGARAVRRALFELSWRVFGRETFTAAGLPGRLFPHS